MNNTKTTETLVKPMLEPVIDISLLKKVHFIGIGGIGISAIARMMLLEGKQVSGSDSSSSPVTDELIKKGAQVFIGHEASHIQGGIDAVVYTTAVSADNLELVAAREAGMPVVTYPQMLGIISRDKYTIAVSGTHGKTTTTAMIGKILIDAGLEPTMVVGSMLKNKDGENSNFIAGKGKYFIVEACEYRRSFLNLNPTIAVITNIDNDHLDYYKDIDGITEAFKEFTEKLPEDGYLVCDTHGANLDNVIKDQASGVVDYSSQISNVPKLKFPGKHNVNNAAAALAVAEILGIPSESAKKSLEEFNGTWRRFEYKGLSEKEALVYDDYGHHPTEIQATLLGAREMFPDRKIIAVFQPHLFSRTKMLLKDFGLSFKNADEAVVLPIYAARERNDQTITSEMLVDEIEENGAKAVSVQNFDDAFKYLSAQAKKGDVIMTIGAGDVYKIGEKLVVK